MMLSPSKHTAPLSPMTPPTPLAHDAFAMPYQQYTPGVRMSPRRKIHNTPGWPSTMPMDFPETIRMYSDPEAQDETVNFTMNAEFIESIAPRFLTLRLPLNLPTLSRPIISRICWGHYHFFSADNAFIRSLLCCCFALSTWLARL